MKLYLVKTFGSVIGVFKDPVKAVELADQSPRKSDDDGYIEAVVVVVANVESDL